MESVFPRVSVEGLSLGNCRRQDGANWAGPALPTLQLRPELPSLAWSATNKHQKVSGLQPGGAHIFPPDYFLLFPEGEVQLPGAAQGLAEGSFRSGDRGFITPTWSFI